MNKNTIIKQFGILIILLTVGFSGFAQKNSPIRVELKVDDVYKVELPITPSSGFVWIIAYPPDSNFIISKGHIFIPDSDTAKKGSPGKDVFSFKALKAGETTVSFAFKPEYSRHVNRVEEYTFIIKKQ